MFIGNSHKWCRSSHVLEASPAFFEPVGGPHGLGVVQEGHLGFKRPHKSKKLDKIHPKNFTEDSTLDRIVAILLPLY